MKKWIWVVAAAIIMMAVMLCINEDKKQKAAEGKYAIPEQITEVATRVTVPPVTKQEESATRVPEQIIIEENKVPTAEKVTKAVAKPQASPTATPSVAPTKSASEDVEKENQTAEEQKPKATPYVRAKENKEGIQKGWGKLKDSTVKVTMKKLPQNGIGTVKTEQGNSVLVSGETALKLYALYEAEKGAIYRHVGVTYFGTEYYGYILEDKIVVCSDAEAELLAKEIGITPQPEVNTDIEFTEIPLIQQGTRIPVLLPSTTLAPVPEPTEVPNATVKPAPTVTVAPIATATPVPTVVPTSTMAPVPEVTATPVPTSTPKVTINSGQTAIVTVTPRATVTPVPVATKTPIATNRPVATATPVPTATAKPIVTVTPIPTATPMPTATPAPAGELVTRRKYDYTVIPDKYNTGCSGSLTKINSACTVDGVEYALGNNGTMLVIDWYYRNKDTATEIIIRNVDFSDLDFGIRNASLVDVERTVRFENCKFGSVSVELNQENATYIFTDCSIVRFYGSNCIFNNCYFGGGGGDAMNPFRNVVVSNSYFCGFPQWGENGTHIDAMQVYGKENIDAENILFSNCRIEIPIIKSTGSKNSINACLMVALEYSNAQNFLFEDCIINGGGYSIYATNQKEKWKLDNIVFRNISVGRGRLYGQIYPTIAEGVVFDNIYETEQLYVSSVWKDSLGKIHLSVTNDTVEDKTLLIVTENGRQEVLIPCKKTSEAAGAKEYYDLAIDMEVVTEDAGSGWVVCYDGTESAENQIRFVNWSGATVYRMIE